MALNDPYLQPTDLAAYLGIADATDDEDLLTEAIAAAQAEVNDHCGRQFNDADTASARVFDPTTCTTLYVDDFHTTTGLLIDGTPYDADLHALFPRNGIEGQQPGFPFRKIVLRSGSWSEPVTVTARWGWAAVPDAVVRATKIIAAEVHNLKDSPLGVASFGDAGLIRVREIPQAARLLRAYRHPSAAAMVA